MASAIFLETYVPRWNMAIVKANQTELLKILGRIFFKGPISKHFFGK